MPGLISTRTAPSLSKKPPWLRVPLAASASLPPVQLQTRRGEAVRGCICSAVQCSRVPNVRPPPALSTSERKAKVRSGSYFLITKYLLMELTLGLAVTFQQNHISSRCLM
ncbi:hypothetical protein CCHR01_02478 [Colletotrichum chrysophilum]|uniref:Uncharacterized protein n=1 Tax=Colletotrichum chrysophilum TaxID=1836956 RepID=A0AAD9ENC3_9PEZI|nr:hypothetical protein CCHR01_02478 [Colletotrichum chrysophilum]